MSKAIVTGATGFIGSNLCRYLLDTSWEVIILTRKSSDYSSLKSIIHKIEIFEYDGKIDKLIHFFNSKKVDVVFHLAAFSITEHETTHIGQLVDSNITFGLHILEAMKYSKTRYLINTGTAWQHYKNSKYNPVNLYAATKQAFESLIMYYVETEDIRVVTLKLFDTYGETDTRPKLLNLLYSHAFSQTELRLSPGDQNLDLVHVDDVAKAYVQSYKHLLQEGSKYAEFGVGTGSSIKLKDLVTMFERLSGVKLKIVWGGRQYRRREVMDLWSTCDYVPEWQIEIELEKGLQRYIALRGYLKKTD